MIDILVFIPVLRLEPETIKGIFQLEWGGSISILFQQDNPHKNDGRQAGILNHLHQYQRGRQLFLSGPFDAMLVIESDIIPPPDTLQRLADLDCDVAYGCYRFQASPVVNVFEKYYAGTNKKARNIGESLTVRGLWQAAVDQGVIECSGAGLGCVLIRRHVLEKIPFRIEPGGAHCDSYFTVDVYQAGYSMLADTAVICGHKTAAGEVVYPDG